MSEIERFRAEVEANIRGLEQDEDLQAFSRVWVREVTRHRYAYNFTWMGRPIIQTPQDMVAMQELIWRIQPDLIVETGIAHGGSLIYYASLLELLGGDRYVLGIDIDIRAHNREEIAAHPMHKRIQTIEGSSISEEVAAQVREHARGKERVLVVLDSNHTEEHVLRELELYAPLVTKDSYLVVFDTLIEDMPVDLGAERPWGPGNSPKSAVWRFIETTDRFEIDTSIPAKLLITVAPDGYLRCVAD